LALGAFFDALGGLPTDWESELSARVQVACEKFHFSSTTVVTAFLADYGHTVENLDKALDEMSLSFKPVSTAPISTLAVGWRAGLGRSGAGHGGPHRKLTVDDLVDESLACGAVGNAAEKALLSWVLQQAASLKDLKGFAEAVLSVFKPGSKTFRDVKDALERGDLEGALYVADRWSGAGFDILGLESVDDHLTPVRYECKAISSSSPRVRIHLSRNEIAVARRVSLSGPGRWMLVGVQPDGQCVDLTGLVADLIDEAEAPLAPLHELGLEPDGLRLVVERAAQTDEPPVDTE